MVEMAAWKHAKIGQNTLLPSERVLDIGIGSIAFTHNGSGVVNHFGESSSLLPGPPSVPKSMSLYRECPVLVGCSACVVNGKASVPTITEPRITASVVARVLGP